MSQNKILQNMQDKELAEIIILVKDLDSNGWTDSEKLRTYAKSWYEDNTILMQFAQLEIDVFREATERWLSVIN
jgi:hypothetical protein